jgi:Tol biopolymer transport system component
VVLGLAASAASGVATTRRVSVSSAEVQGNAASNTAFISSGGRYVVFISGADNLVGDDQNTFRDAFLRDRRRGRTRLVSVSSTGEQANNNVDCYSNGSPVSGDGRFVVFTSLATNLLQQGDGNGATDVFIRDRENGTTGRVSVSSAEEEATGGDSTDAAISRNGRFVVFHSNANNLVPNDNNNATDVFIRDRKKGITRRVSINSAEDEGNGDSGEASVSDDGRYVLFASSATNLVPNDTNNARDAFVRDRWTGTTRRVNVSSAEAQANNGAIYMSISASGRFIVFESGATSLVRHDTNADDDVFVRDRREGTTRRVSVSSTERQANGWSGYPKVSPSGRFVAFEAADTNLVSGDANGVIDIFVRDLVNGTTRRVTSKAGGTAPSGSQFPTITADGRFVAFESDVTNLVADDTNDVSDVFVRGPLG